jgi:polar amino acid transport system permease protein
MPSSVLAAGLNFDFGFFLHALLHPTSSFLAGLWRTIYISVLAQSFGILIGLGIALMRHSKRGWLNGIAGAYIWVIRGTPLLVQLVLVYDGLASVGLYKFPDLFLFGIDFPGVIQAALITLAINESAYMAEIIRSGIDSVPKGQLEAALAVGMTQRSAMRWVVLPQAVRIIMPPLGNDFNAMMKTTSLLSVIGVQELFLNAQEISSTTFRTLEIFLVAALYYLILTTIWSIIQSLIERRLDAGSGIVRAPSVTQRLFGGSRPSVSAATGGIGE